MIRVDDDETVQTLTETTIADAGYDEDDLREWILDDPESILGEELLIIGREIRVTETNDRIDLLGIDPNGDVVIVELKQARIGGDVDFQALKYAAYASRWDTDKLRDRFERFQDETEWGRSLYGSDTTFGECIDEFCNEEYEINQHQRIILVGESLGTRIRYVTEWLSENAIDVVVREVQLFTDDDRTYLDVDQVVPTPTPATVEVQPDTSTQLWKRDGRDWHCNEICNDATAELLTAVVDALADLELLSGPSWSQKQYVSFTQHQKNRVIARTRKTQFNIQIYDVDVDGVDPAAVADRVGVDPTKIKTDASDLRNGRAGIQITCQGGDNVDIKGLAAFTREVLEDHTIA